LTEYGVAFTLEHGDESPDSLLIAAIDVGRGPAFDFCIKSPGFVSQ
jgi:hypothetical protein